MKAFLTALLAMAIFLTGCGALSVQFNLADADQNTAYDKQIILPMQRYPETMAHIAAAIDSGASAVCTIDRNGAEANRSASLHGIPTKKGFDRDEWPMAMCKEGGAGAHIAYVTPKDNRGAGSWIGNQLTNLKDGTRVLFVVDQAQAVNTDVDSVTPPSPSSQPEIPKKSATEPQATPSPAPAEDTVYYANCAAAREAGAAPLHKGDPGYRPKLDRDGDGIACSS